MTKLLFFGVPTCRKAGDIEDIRTRKGMALLAYLAATGERQHRDIVATLLWPEHDQTAARANLRRTLYRLRQTAVGGWVVVDRDHVGLAMTSAGSIDIIDFQEHIQEGRLVEAVALYRGDFLSGFYLADSSDYEEWATQQREMYRRHVLEALFELGGKAEEGEEYEAMIDYAQRQLQIDPLRECAIRQLLTGLTYAGRRNEALAVYERSCRLLEAELGVSPQVETVALYERIMAGEVQTSDSTPMLFRQRHNLPVEMTPFWGRVTELEQLTGLLCQTEVRLVTIVAPGGMGKTRLALAVAEGFVLSERRGVTETPFGDGVFWVDLTAMEDPDSILEAVGAAMSIRFKPEVKDQRQQILEYLGRRRILLVMDNFEHLLAGVEVVREILESAVDVKVLVTSRLPLNLLGETRMPLTGVDYPREKDVEGVGETTAVRLFVATAQRMMPGFTMGTKDMGDVVRICQLVQGMPLGIILASSWIEVLSPAEIVTEMEAGLGILATDMTDVPARQRSMQAVLAYSWALLSTDEQGVFARLSVFRGGFTREAAEIVVKASLPTLQTFARRSLLQRDEGGRYRIHELLRQFAEDQLQRVTDAPDVYQRHAQYYAELARGHYFDVVSLREPASMDLIEAEMDNIRRAWRYGLSQQRADLLAAISSTISTWYNLKNRHWEVISILQGAIAAIDDWLVPGGDEHLARICLAEACVWIGIDPERSEQLALEVLSILDNGPVTSLHLATYEVLRTYATFVSDDRSKRRWTQKGLETATALDDSFSETLWHFYALQWSDTDRQSQTRLQMLNEMLQELTRVYPQRMLNLWIYYSIGRTYLEEGLLKEAIAVSRQGLQIASQWGNLYAMSDGYHVLSEIYWRDGQDWLARQSLRECILAHLQIGQDWQLLGWIMECARHFPELVGGDEMALSYLSMVYYHTESVTHYRIDIDDSLSEFAERMADPSFTMAWEKGKTLGLAYAVSQLLAILQ